MGSSDRRPPQPPAAPRPAVTIARAQITGMVLAGGRGSRMGGVDKGLQRLNGQPLVWHGLQRLAPQVGALAVNANRHLDDYRALGVPVWPDALADYPGPLAGMLSGLAHCGTQWLVTVPCDTPRFPADLVQRLADAAAAAGAEVAIAATLEGGAVQPQPVFCLLHRDLHEPLARFLTAGERKIDRFTGARRHVQVTFDDAAAFANANTAAELDALRGGSPPAPV